MPGQFDTDVTITVEVAFGSAPFDTTPTWTDVTGDVRRFKTQRGRSNAVSRVGPGKATIWLDNSSGAYDPSNAAGAYSPDVDIMTPVRISADYTVPSSFKLDTAGRGLGSPLQVDTAPLFTGFVESWPQQYVDGVDPVVPMRATDAIKLFNALETDGTPLGPANIRQAHKDVLVGAGWPAAWVDGYVSEWDTQAFTPGGAVLRTLRRLEDTDGGMFFIEADGDSMFHNRTYRSGLSSTVTFGDSSTELPYTLDFDMEYDDTQLWNQVEVTRRGGTKQTSNSTASIDSYTKHVLPRSDTLHNTDADALTMGAGLVATYKDPHLRLDDIRFKPRRSPALAWPVALTYDLSQNVTVKRRPASGNVISLNEYVEGITHDVTVGKSWECTFIMSQYAGT